MLDAVGTTEKWKTVSLRKFEDWRGNLCVVEATRDIPFDFSRVYYLYDVPVGEQRAGHAHKSLRQLFIAPSGSFCLNLESATDREAIVLSRPDVGVIVEPGVWRVLDGFSEGAVCMVVASLRYDESDYIRSYDDFRRYVGTAI